ncbi:hypothetical protein CEXT_197521 [Caerostris extrusa]|uniref:Uncharacterized protein n=1 Tax=Caerostris extrusa TaxID=172846 RepID=A0AAV4SZH5_CAEEX|nr:hypothetical protein CEXT_197521 [Caerostris extrusa]
MGCIDSLPSDVAKLIARDSEEEALNYVHVKEMPLEIFTIDGEKFRQQFRQHRKAPSISRNQKPFLQTTGLNRSHQMNWLIDLDAYCSIRSTSPSFKQTFNPMEGISKSYNPKRVRHLIG